MSLGGNNVEDEDEDEDVDTCFVRVRNFSPLTCLKPKLVTRLEHSFTWRSCCVTGSRIDQDDGIHDSEHDGIHDSVHGE